MFDVSIYYICFAYIFRLEVNPLENDPFLRIEGEKFNRACLVFGLRNVHIVV